MTDVRTDYLTPPAPELSRRVSIVGVGDTDYRADYQASRSNAPGYVPPTTVSLAKTAFERALADAHLEPGDVDGLCLCFVYGADEEVDTVADALGIKPRLARHEPIPLLYDVIPSAVHALMDHECDTVALVYSAPSRAIGRRYGGSAHSAGSVPLSYYYYHPWGWSSQAADWALILQYYRNTFGASEEDLGHVAMTLRRNAARNPNAIMQTPLSLDDYMSARFIVRPLRLFDMCLVNDGGVCVILQRSDMAKDRPHDPVDVAGWAHAKGAHTSQKLEHLVRERMQPEYRAAGDQAFAMADLERADVGHFQGYDAASIHLICQLEGYGLVPTGEGLEFAKAGALDLDGAMPVNTSGGMLSEAYMHGWNHLAEAVRQLRHEAGERQVPDVEVSLFSMADTDSTHPLLLTRGGS